jgi:hypothetical protein
MKTRKTLGQPVSAVVPATGHWEALKSRGQGQHLAASAALNNAHGAIASRNWMA